MFFSNAFARPGMFASQRNNFQVPNAQPQPAPPPQQLPSGYQAQSYQTFSARPGIGALYQQRAAEPMITNDMGMSGFLDRQAQSMPQPMSYAPVASNTMGMEQPRFYQPPQMMGIMSLLSGLFGDNFGQPPVPIRAVGETPRPDFNMVDNDMGMSNFRDRPKASPPSASVSPPTRVTDMFGSPQGLGGFTRPQMGFGGKGGIKGGGMYGQPSYGMQARYSSPFQGFF
jgi:hypothetical protein